MTIPVPGPGSYYYINIGNGVSCGSCAAGTVITGYGSGIGSGGTYTVSPSQTVTSTTLTITHNNLDFNGAWGYGATITGTVSSGVLTVSGVQTGVMAPLLIASDGTNSATLTACLTNCSLMGSSQATSTWQLSSSALNGDTSTTTFSIAPSGGALWPSLQVQPSSIPVYFSGPTAIGGEPLMQAGTFQVLVNGTPVCQDTSTFAYNIQAGNCVGAGRIERLGELRHRRIFDHLRDCARRATPRSSPSGQISCPRTVRTATSRSIGWAGRRRRAACLHRSRRKLAVSTPISTASSAAAAGRMACSGQRINSTISSAPEWPGYTAA